MLTRIIGVLVAVNGILLGILGANGLFEGFKIPDTTRIWVVYAAGVGILLLSGLLVFVLVRYGVDRSTAYRIARRGLDLLDCEEKHLAAIDDWAHECFGDYATDSAGTRRLHGIDPSIFAVAEDSVGKLRGYFCLIRLTAAGVSALERDDFDATHIPSEYIRKDGKTKYCCIYVGAVYGDNLPARGFVLGALHSRIKEIRPRKVFARAASPDGLRVLRSNKFRPLDIKDTQGSVGDLFVREGFAR